MILQHECISFGISRTAQHRVGLVIEAKSCMTGISISRSPVVKLTGMNCPVLLDEFLPECTVEFDILSCCSVEEHVERESLIAETDIE